jgi:hypothetical protein
MSSLALLAAGAATEGDVAGAIIGGHGELFVQQFDAATLESMGGVDNLAPADAAGAITAPLVVGSGAGQLIEARGWGEAREAFPSAMNALTLPESMRNLAAKPIYARAPDARVLEPA